MTPKDGKPGEALAPLAPKAVEEADSADPGEVSAMKARQAESQSGKYGSAKIKPFKLPPQGESQAQSAEQEDQPVSWIEIELVGEDDKPIPSERYKVTLPDESVAEGSLDQYGFARIAGFAPPGTCKVSFPDLDQDAWEFIESVGAKTPGGTA